MDLLCCCNTSRETCEQRSTENKTTRKKKHQHLGVETKSRFSGTELFQNMSPEKERTEIAMWHTALFSPFSEQRQARQRGYHQH